MDVIEPSRGHWRRKAEGPLGRDGEPPDLKGILFLAGAVSLAVVLWRVRSLQGLMWVGAVVFPLLAAFFYFLIHLLYPLRHFIPYDKINTDQTLSDHSTRRVHFCNKCHEVKQAGEELRCPCGGYWEDFEKWEWVEEK